MTPAELDAEWRYRYAERVGILCPDLHPDKKPEREVIEIAAKEVDEAIEELKNDKTIL